MTASLGIDDVLKALDGLDVATREATVKQAEDLIRKEHGSLPAWLPNPGPQLDAYFCEADELFYGGQAGGGKTDLAVGLALTAHTRSLLLRKYRDDAKDMADRLLEVAGTRNGWNGQDLIFRQENCTVRFGGCNSEEEKQRFKGKPFDLYVFDEVSDFAEAAYTFIIGWNRSAKPGQRCRILATGNPPTTPEGLWVLRRWAAWLDPTHPNPAKPGELRWYTTGEDGKEVEVEGRGPHLISGEMVEARSRTFIPAKLSDNPDLAATNYAATLAALPEELRAAYRDGRFDLGLKDKPYQAIPTAWVRAAQARWKPKPPEGIPMCAMGVDASGGGTDPMVIAQRHDGWYAPLIQIEGKDIPIERAGAFCAGLVVSHRRDSAKVIIDLGGGYGSSMYEQLHANHIDPAGYKGANSAFGKTKCGKFTFKNKRSMSIWKFREALDPGQPGGSQIALPPDPELVADLTAPTYKPDAKEIIVESKVDVCKRLGRSTNKGDAVVMAYTDGAKTANVPGGFQNYARNQAPKVVMGHQAARRRR